MTEVNHATGEITGEPQNLGPLDRYGPLEAVTPQQAAMVMVRVQRMRREQIAEIERLRREVARLRAVAEKAKARAQLNAEGTVEDRKAKGRLDSAERLL